MPILGGPPVQQPISTGDGWINQVWADWFLGLWRLASKQLKAYSASGAIAEKNGTVFLTKAGVAAMTLSAPTATSDDNKQLTIISTTAQAHTVNQASPGFNSGGAASDVATFGGAIGDSISLVAYQGVWYVESKTNVTLA